MVATAPTLWLPASMQALPPGNVLPQGVQVETILGDRYISFAPPPTAPTTGKVDNMLACASARFSGVAKAFRILGEAGQTSHGSFVGQLSTDQTAELLRFAIEGRYDPDKANFYILSFIEAMSRSGWTYEEQKQTMITVQEKAGNSDLSYYYYRNAADSVFEMTSKGWRCYDQLRMFSASSSGNDFGYIKTAVIAMEEAHWEHERQIKVFGQMAKRSNLTLEPAVRLLSFLIKSHPEDADCRVLAILGSLNEEGIELPKDIDHDAETTSSYTMSAIGKDLAIETALYRARFLKQWLGFLDQNKLPEWLWSRYIKPLASIKLNDDLFIQLEMGTAEAKSGLQFSLFSGSREPLCIGSVGFVETDDRIVIVRYQGGDIGEEKAQKVHEEFRKFSGEVLPMPWLGYFAGRFLLGRAFTGGKKLEWLAGDYLLHGYPHLKDNKPRVKNVDSAKRVLEEGSSELAEYKETRRRLSSEKEEIERRLAELWKKGNLNDNEVNRLRGKLSRIEDYIEWFSQPLEMLERAPGRQYDIIAKKLGFKKKPGEAFYTFSATAGDFGKKVKAGAADAAQFNRSIETADGAISKCFVVWPKNKGIRIDLLAEGETGWPTGRNPFLTAYRPPAELATSALLSGETPAKKRTPIPRKVAEAIGTNSATILENAGDTYLVQNDETGELHAVRESKLPYFYFPKAGKMFRNGALVDAEIVKSRHSFRVIQEAGGQLTAWHVDNEAGDAREEKYAYFPEDKKVFSGGSIKDAEIIEVIGYNHLIKVAGEKAIQAWTVYPEGEAYPVHGICYFPKSRKGTFKNSEILEHDGDFYIIKSVEHGEEFMVVIRIDPVTGEVNRVRGHYFPEHNVYYNMSQEGSELLPAVILEGGKVTRVQQLQILSLKNPVILSRASDGSLNPLIRAVYIDDSFSFVTDAYGRALLIEPYQIEYTGFYMAKIPEPVVQLGTARDGSGYYKNIEIFTRNGDGTFRTATREEAVMLAKRYLGERSPKVTLIGEGVRALDEPKRATLKTPKIKEVPAYAQRISIEGVNRNVDIFIEADSPEEFSSAFLRLMAAVKEVPIELFTKVKRIEVYKNSDESYGFSHKNAGGSYTYGNEFCRFYDFNEKQLRSSIRRILYHELIHSSAGSLADKRNEILVGIALKADGSDAYRLLRAYFGASGNGRGYFASEIGEYAADAGTFLLSAILFPNEFDDSILQELGKLKFTSSLIADIIENALFNP